MPSEKIPAEKRLEEGRPERKDQNCALPNLQFACPLASPHGSSVRGPNGTGKEKIVIVEIAVHVSSNLRRFGPERGPSALQENHDYNASTAGVCIGGEPAETSSGVRAGPRLAQNLFFAEVETKPARRAVLHRASHAIGDFRNERSDIKLTLNTRLEICDFFR